MMVAITGRIATQPSSPAQVRGAAWCSASRTRLHRPQSKTRCTRFSLWRRFITALGSTPRRSSTTTSTSRARWCKPTSSMACWRRLLIQKIQDHIHADLDGVLVHITGAGHRGLSLECTTDVVFRVDDHPAAVDLDALEKWLDRAHGDRQGHIGAIDVGLTTFDRLEIVPDSRSEHLVIGGNPLERIVGEQLLRQPAEAAVE